MTKDFIFELGCEELPSAAVSLLANELKAYVVQALDKAQLGYGVVKSYATPRRLALTIAELQEEQPSQLITKRGPAAVAAYDKEGNPTQALLGFAKSCAVSLDALSRIRTDKGDWIVYESNTVGRVAQELLPEVISHALAQLPITKPMRWGSGDDEFARPVHWTVMLWGDEVIEHQILGTRTGRFSFGHRFHHPEPIRIDSAATYEAQMKEAFVIADFSLRRQMIQEQVMTLAASYDAVAVMPEDLLDEVTSIVEWPQALLAHFEKEFLAVPPEALIASMQAHQKCFALNDHHGALLPHFITVANIVSTHPKQVVLGNEKVMRARLSDAAFFFHQDKKNPLSQHREATKQVVFQAQLGSVYDKTQRVTELMRFLSQKLPISVEHAVRAAALSKCDLLTGMVGEFPELQGLMGYYYAVHDGEAMDVAHALNEQYMPRFAADHLPSSLLGSALSLAERIDTLVGIFAIGQKPSGVKDPFKLRRHALAVVRLLTSLPYPLPLSELIAESVRVYGALLPAGHELALQELKPFILERLNSYYQSQGVSLEKILAVRYCQDECFYDLDKRLTALNAFMALPEAAALSAACKRVNNLLSHASMQVNQNVNELLLKEAAEQAIYHHMSELNHTLVSLYQSANYEKLLQQLARIKEPVDAFFEQVMVMVDDQALKTNRLILLTQLQKMLQGVADISMLQLS